MAGQRVDYSGAAHGLCRDPAYEGASDGAADQQEAPKCRAGICQNDAGRFVKAGACEDATCTGAADAVDEPQAPTNSYKGNCSTWNEIYGAGCAIYALR